MVGELPRVLLRGSGFGSCRVFAARAAFSWDHHSPRAQRPPVPSGPCVGQRSYRWQATRRWQRGSHLGLVALAPRAPHSPLQRPPRRSASGLRRAPCEIPAPRYCPRMGGISPFPVTLGSTALATSHRSATPRPKAACRLASRSTPGEETRGERRKAGRGRRHLGTEFWAPRTWRRGGDAAGGPGGRVRGDLGLRVDCISFVSFINDLLSKYLASCRNSVSADSSGHGLRSVQFYRCVRSCPLLSYHPPCTWAAPGLTHLLHRQKLDFLPAGQYPCWSLCGVQSLPFRLSPPRVLGLVEVRPSLVVPVDMVLMGSTCLVTFGRRWGLLRGRGGGKGAAHKPQGLSVAFSICHVVQRGWAAFSVRAD